MTSSIPPSPFPDGGTSLLLAFNVPPLGGGIPRMWSEIARRYPRGTLVVSTGTVPDAAASDARFPQPVDRVGVPATRLRTVNGLVRWTARAARLAGAHRAGFTWCGELKPAGYPARWLRARHGLPYGLVLFGTELLWLEWRARGRGWHRWTAARLLTGAGVIVAISSYTAERARAVLDVLGCGAAAARIRLVPLGTDPGRFRPDIETRPVRARYGLDGGPWLLTVARLEWHKGIDTVIRALPAVRARCPGTRYAVAGSGPRRAELEALARDVGVADAVRFLGLVPEADLPALYPAADLYVGASRVASRSVEGFGISLAEASASGVAVVAGRSGGVAEAVRDGETGLLVDPEAPAAVASAVLRLLDDRELRGRLGAAGRRRVETYYNWDRVAADFIRTDAEHRRQSPAPGGP